MKLSPLAFLVLQDHQARPDEAMYDIAAFGPKARIEPLSQADFDRLASAYEELEAAGLVERVDRVERFQRQFFYLYRLVKSVVPAPTPEGVR